MALLGNLKGSAQLFQNTEFYNGVATQSLRFEDGDSSYLYRTPSSAGNRRTFTFSAWIKRANLDENNVGGGSDTTIFSAGTSNVFDSLRFVSQSFTSIKNILHVYTWDGSADYSEEANRGFRDVGSWYHIVFAVDTTQSTAGNRIKYYINGTLQTSVSQYYAQVPQNYQFSYNHTEPQWIGRNVNSTARYFDGYMSEVNFVDGTQYDASYFGETKNGVWIAKEPDVTYGTNGFRLQFKGVGGNADSSGIGADTSGNGNHFSISGFTAFDSVWKDCPENNFATLTTISGFSSTYTNGNLKYTTANPNPATSTISIPTSGKWYWEVYVSSVGEAIIGVQNRPNIQSNGYSGRKTTYYREGGSGGGSGSIYIEGTGYGGDQASYTNGDVISVLYNADDMKIAWYKNGSQEGLTFDVTDTDVTPIVWQASGSGSTSGTFNFGQDSTFDNTISQGGNSDANGIGDFKYTVPSGYLALCSSNFPEPTIGPNSATQADDHFNTILYTGNGGSHALTGVGFQPDWIWIKNRTSSVDYHNAYDSSRGTGRLYPNDTNAEETGHIVSYDTDGFTLNTNNTNSNASSTSYVAWNWKANGGTKTTNDASATSVGSIDSDIQANTTAGFSIVQYETNSGTSGSSQTVAHGLSQAPNWMILKSRDQAGTGWMVYYGDNTDYVTLNGGGATIDGLSTWNDTTPTSTVFSIGTNGGDTNNTNGGSMIGYIFHDVDGYSKFGNYTGNGSADGPFVFTGFRPAWVLIKNTARSADWRLHDIARQPTNDDGGHILLPNSPSAEVTSEYDIDFLSNGFKLKSGDVYENGDGELITYAAFAEAPFKYANAK